MVICPATSSSDSMTFNDSLLLAASGYQPLLLSASRSDQNWSRTLAKRKIENEDFPKTMNWKSKNTFLSHFVVLCLDWKKVKHRFQINKQRSQTMAAITAASATIKTTVCQPRWLTTVEAKRLLLSSEAVPLSDCPPGQVVGTAGTIQHFNVDSRATQVVYMEFPGVQYQVDHRISRQVVMEETSWGLDWFVLHKLGMSHKVSM